MFFDWFFSNIIPLKQARPDMVDWSDIKKWVFYREVWSDLGSYNMRMWVRPDLAQKYGFTEDSRSDVPADYPQAMANGTSYPRSKQSRHVNEVLIAKKEKYENDDSLFCFYHRP